MKLVNSMGVMNFCLLMNTDGSHAGLNKFKNFTLLLEVFFLNPGCVYLAKLKKKSNPF